ncbi:uncharacterized protein PADG_08664 [Paracoccidioides brasiliensis Pb18]|uniref:Sequence orphan n=1 Tax=Paracoccidioides brasiliensis (strain Pb18) TaxID=502780 RepID=C1GN04_PARBD|nr:uncharacterized protein PADG_08664 [Paracoccidioides brasiliensis Pb18]EEH45006.1 hypothetical protein PADG_08664 [Paracoccidioides brasiliensis Pb18]ODH45598.1 hypothetical protein GX48_08326 [Paracoccidioides brasiliensis]
MSREESTTQLPSQRVSAPTIQTPQPSDFPNSSSLSTRKWNTDSLGSRLAVDAASAAGAASLICPLITIIDKSIIEKAAKGILILQSLKSSLVALVKRPHSFFISTPFLLIYTLYGSTYLTANVIDTVTSTINDRAFSNVCAGPAKFIATAAVNMSICVYKDARFARIFGAQGSSPVDKSSPASQSGMTQPNRNPVYCYPSPSNAPESLPIPKRSFALFCLRDSMTIFASFNLPTLLSPHIPDILASTPSSKTMLAQFSIPASVQLFSTPLHLLGLDLYNRQPEGGLLAADRWSRVKRDWAPSCIARVGRIVPAYGFGGVANTKFRASLMKSLE